MDTRKLLAEKREDILRIAAQHGAFNVRLFGSVARGEARPDSDIDLLLMSALGPVRSFLADWSPTLKSCSVGTSMSSNQRDCTGTCATKF
jgi:predicted nucleotidyltransferase